jgi:hypothetical protein
MNEFLSQNKSIPRIFCSPVRMDACEVLLGNLQQEMGNARGKCQCQFRLLSEISIFPLPKYLLRIASRVGDHCRGLQPPTGFTQEVEGANCLL